MIQGVYVNQADLINEIENGAFIYCKSLEKGLIKKDFSALNINIQSFENIVAMLESLDHATLSYMGFDSILFDMGEILKSTKLQKYVDSVALPTISKNADKNAFAAAYKLKRRYFDYLELNEVEINNNFNTIYSVNVLSRGATEFNIDKTNQLKDFDWNFYIDIEGNLRDYTLGTSIIKPGIKFKKVVSRYSNVIAIDENDKLLIASNGVGANLTLVNNTDTWIDCSNHYGCAYAIKSDGTVFEISGTTVIPTGWPTAVKLCATHSGASKCLTIDSAGNLYVKGQPKIPGVLVKEVSGSHMFDVAIKEDGQLIYSNDMWVTYNTVAGMTNCKKISAGYYRCGVLKEDGSLWTITRAGVASQAADGTDWKDVWVGYDESTTTIRAAK